MAKKIGESMIDIIYSLKDNGKVIRSEVIEKH